MVRSRAKISTIYPPAVNELWTGQQQRPPRTKGCSGDRSFYGHRDWLQKRPVSDRPADMLGPSLNERQSRWDFLTDCILDQVHTLVCMMDADRRRPLNRCGESV